MSPRYDDDIPEYDEAYERDTYVEDGDDDAHEACRSCGRPIPTDSLRCLYCGRHVGRGLGFFRDGSWWVVVLVVLGILSTIAMLALGL